MRFVVDLFRYIIIGLCAAVLITIVVAVIAVFDQSEPLTSGMTAMMLAAAVAVLAVLILNIGGIAILISIHDRHAELVESADVIASSLQQLARSPSDREQTR